MHLMRNVSLALSTLSLLGLIVACFLEIAKRSFVPSIEPNFDTLNLRFGSIISATVVAFVCFNILIAHFLPIGIEKIFPIEDNKWTKFGFGVFLSVVVFFFAGIAGIITAIFHVAVSIFVLIIDICFKWQQFDDIE